MGMEVKAESRGLRVKGRRVAKEECRGRIPKRADFRVAQENRNAENATFLSFSSILMISIHISMQRIGNSVDRVYHIKLIILPVIQK